MSEREPITTDESERVMDLEFARRDGLSGGQERDRFASVTLRFGGLTFGVYLSGQDRLDLIRGLSGVPVSVPLSCKLQPSTVPADHFVQQGYVVLDGETLNARRWTE